VESETNELVDGSLIDLCGATLLWRSAEGIAKGPVRIAALGFILRDSFSQFHADYATFGEDGRRPQRRQTSVSSWFEHAGFAEEIDTTTTGSDALRLPEVRARTGTSSLGQSRRGANVSHLP
jgi:hypothetical protein